MSLTVFDASADFLKRYAFQMKEALKDFTHFGMDGGLGFERYPAAALGYPHFGKAAYAFHYC